MTDSENSPERETPETEPQEQPTLAELLAADEPEQGAPDEGAGEAGESQTKAEPEAETPPKTLQEWAEKFGTEAKDLYAVEVPISQGDETKNVTLGELKDTYGQAQDLDRRELEIEERKANAEADLTRAQTELRAILQALPEGAVNEKVLKFVRQKAEAELSQERQATLDAIPEWRDETRREADLQGMVKLLGDYGLSPQYLQSQFDHRLVRLIRDSFLRKQRIDKALARVNKVKRPSNTGKSTPSGSAKKPGKAAPSEGSTPEDRLMTLLNG